MKININIKVVFQYIFLYIMLMLHGAIYWSNVYDQTFLPIVMILSVTIMLSIGYSIKMPDTEFLITLAIFSILFLISGLVHSKSLIYGMDFKPLLFIWGNMLVANLAYQLDKKKACARFLRLICFFAFISLIVYVFCMFGGAPIIKNHFAGFRPTAGTRTYYGKYLFSILWSKYEIDGYRRNIGIFYEPGVYQIVLNAAIYIIVFCRDIIEEKQKKINIYLVILILALLSTGSTTGYLGLIFIFMGAIFQNKGKNSKKIKIIVIVAVLLVILDYIKNGDSSFVQSYLFNKLEGASGSISDMRHTSGGARMIVFMIALDTMKKHPVFGIGNHAGELALERLWGKKFGAGNVLCGLTTKKGFVTVATFITALLRLAWKNKPSLIAFLVFAVLYINTTFAQSQLGYGTFFFIAMLETQNIINSNEDIKALTSKEEVSA